MKKKNDLTKVRTGRKADVLARAFLDNLYYLQGCSLEHASKNDLYMALSYTVRDRMLASWIQGLYEFAKLKPDQKIKTVSYLSAEFLPGPHLAN
ncbi:glycogen/starch/alpha-glucan phosphorylase, partial [bacterium]|nr:glycogen/starch/alpha-glucan phosphorylase [bacterium]